MKKTNIFRTLALAAALFVCSYSANAQFEFGISFAGGLTTGDMSAKVPTHTDLLGNTYYGNAHSLLGKQYITNGSSPLLGFAFRFGYRIPINNSEYGEIEPYVELGGFWNRPNKDIREQYDNRADFKYPHYINAPIYIGAQYRYPVTDIIKPYAEFGIGYDLLFISNEFGAGALDDYKYNAKGALSGNVGVGCFFSDYVSLGVYYYGLGNHKISLKETSKVSTDPLVAVAQAESAEEFSTRTSNNPVTHNFGTVALRLNFHFGPHER
ncbi:MAG: hypothetical protein IJL38_08070 [Bacteroidales bacterium]|nr:hypothetical protein [Bacteroidales bacterium]